MRRQDCAARGTGAAKDVPTATAEAPADAEEALLLGLWRDVLRRDGFGPTEDFFSLGGNSLDVAALCGAVTRATGKNLPVAKLFRASTIRRQAELLRVTNVERQRDEAPKQFNDRFKLTADQRGLLFEALCEPGLHRHLFAVRLRFIGRLGTETLTEALRTVVARHYLLWSKPVRDAGGDWRWQVGTAYDCPIQLLDIGQNENMGAG